MLRQSSSLIAYVKALNEQALLCSHCASGLSSALHRRYSSTALQDAFGELPERPSRRVVVTGLGLVTPLGVGVQRVWKRLVRGDCGIRALTPEDIPEAQRAAFDKLPAKIAGVVPAEELAQALRDLGASVDTARTARFMEFAQIAAAEALQDAAWAPLDESGRERTGVAIGSGMSASGDLAAAGQIIAAGNIRRLSPYLVPRILANLAAGLVSMQHSFMGPNHAASTACTTGAHAIGDAYNFVRSGDADVMVAGGTEACIDAVAIGGFSRMKALEVHHNNSPATASQPFNADRGGFVIGEGAGVLILEELDHALLRGAKIYAEVRGYGLSADAHHITQPAPDGRGAILAMRRALLASGLPLSAVAYVNAHATSTPLGDAVEAAAIAKVFGVNPAAAESLLGSLAASDESASSAGSSVPSREPQGGLGPVPSDRKEGRGPLLGKLAQTLMGAAGRSPLEEEEAGNQTPSRDLAISSTKGATGHLLGAAGAVEAIFSILALVEAIAPPTLNLERPDPEVLGRALIGRTARPLHMEPKAVLTNSFGFGGTNASLVFATAPALVHEVADGLP